MKRTLAAVCALLIMLSACADKKVPAETETIFALNTVVEFTAYGADGMSGLAAAKNTLTHYESLFSVTIDGSDVSRINGGAGDAVAVDADTAELITRSLELCELTDGNLDITVYPVVRAWGFTAEQYRVPGQDELSGLLLSVDYRRVSAGGAAVTVPADVQLDLGAVAKGYIGDRAIDAMRSAGVTTAIISLGGNVQTLGVKPDGSVWRVAVRDPQNPNEYLGIVEIGEGAVVTSGGYERFFVEDGVTYHHIIDPETGYPANSGLSSVTVVAEGDGCGLYADALTTALYVMGCDAAMELWRRFGGEIDGVSFELVLVSDSGGVTVTPGLETRFKLSEKR